MKNYSAETGAALADEDQTIKAFAHAVVTHQWDRDAPPESPPGEHMGSFSITQWIIVGLIIYGLVKLLSRGSTKPMYCKSCGHSGPTATKTPGSLAIEIVLWLMLIVPGITPELSRTRSVSA